MARKSRLSACVLDSQRKAVHKHMDRIHSNKEKRDAEVNLAETRAKDAAGGDGRTLDDLGMPLPDSIIIRRITENCPGVVVQAGNNSTWLAKVPDIRVEGGLRTVVAFERGLNTEYTKKVLNEDGTLKKVVPGWRRVVMRLIREKVLTSSRADLLFGPPTRDSLAWSRLTK